MRALDGLRALAALGVCAYHFIGPPAYYGLLGVELFFIISGFVILMTLERVGSIAEFAVGRFCRLYPAYWFSVAAAGLILWSTQTASVQTILINATMLQGFFRVPDIIFPYWSLAFELWFYVVMAAIFATRQLDNVDRLALVWLIGMLLLKGMIITTGIGAGTYRFWLVKILFMPQFGHLFIAGMMLYRINTGRATSLTRFALALAIFYSLSGRQDWAEIAPIPYFLINAVFIAAVWAASSGRAAIFSAPPLVALGLCSYSLYLLHVPVQLLLAQLFENLIGYIWFNVAVVLPVAIAAAVIARTYIERPAQIWAKHGRRRNRNVQPI